MRFPHPSNWLLPAVLGIAAVAVAATPWGARVDLALLDLSARLSTKPAPPAVVLVAIDEASTAKLNGGVWKPDIQALVLQRILDAGATAVGYVQFETATTLPAEQVRDLRTRFALAGDADRANLIELERAIASLERVAHDVERLNHVIGTSDRVYLPLGNALSESGEAVLENGHSAGEPHLGARLAYLGLLMNEGSVRGFPVSVEQASARIPAMPLALTARANPERARYYAQSPDARIWLPAAPAPDSAIETVSIADIAANPSAARSVSGKIVLIGSTLQAAVTTGMAPGGVPVSLAALHANAVSQVLRGKAAVRGAWHDGIPVLLCISTLGLAWLLRRASTRAAAALAVAWAVVLVVAQVLVFATVDVWFSSVAPVLMALALPACALVRKNAERIGPIREESASQGDDRLLALAFHEQGQLDQAFDHLKKCPTSEAVLDDLYELGLDYERRRQYAKAQQVFDYIGARSPQRRELLRRTVSKPTLSDSPKVLAGPIQPASQRAAEPTKPAAPKRLGRYELGRELGRGAMGVVYQGRDTTIGRAVAIKTMPLSQEFDAAELDSVKRRFFGEAESAGRLNHSSIVTIYDAGEDQDLAYIAMELLTGKDLSRYTAANRLLPLAVVMSIAARVADALDYAHRLNIVHRDIKPGNIMFDPKTDTVKVTDFGIARITDSNKTKTGMVLGTPSFMSPEQLAGKKIDGQSDLYSLGVTLYQLVCGTLPFQAASLAQLMYKISNDPPADPLAHNPSLPDELVAIIGKALAKEKQQRFTSGAEMAVALRNCASHLATVDIPL